MVGESAGAEGRGQLFSLTLDVQHSPQSWAARLVRLRSKSIAKKKGRINLKSLRGTEIAWRPLEAIVSAPKPDKAIQLCYAISRLHSCIMAIV